LRDSDYKHAHVRKCMSAFDTCVPKRLHLAHSRHESFFLVPHFDACVQYDGRVSCANLASCGVDAAVAREALRAGGGRRAQRRRPRKRLCRGRSAHKFTGVRRWVSMAGQAQARARAGRNVKLLTCRAGATEHEKRAQTLGPLLPRGTSPTEVAPQVRNFLPSGRSRAPAASSKTSFSASCSWVKNKKCDFAPKPEKQNDFVCFNRSTTLEQFASENFLAPLPWGGSCLHERQRNGLCCARRCTVSYSAGTKSLAPGRWAL